MAPVLPGVTAEVTIRLRRGLTIDGKRRLRRRVVAGAAGIIFDARGRPLVMPCSARPGRPLHRVADGDDGPGAPPESGRRRGGPRTRTGDRRAAAGRRRTRGGGGVAAMPYYPDTSVIQALAHVVRDRRLPLRRSRACRICIAGANVEAVNLVLRAIFCATTAFWTSPPPSRSRKLTPSFNAAVLTVEEGERVQPGQELARRGKGRRGKVLAGAGGRGGRAHRRQPHRAADQRAVGRNAGENPRRHR